MYQYISLNIKNVKKILFNYNISSYIEYPKIRVDNWDCIVKF